jgi:hypothetical protein
MHGSHSLSSGQSRHSYARILALDLGKFNSVLCDFDPATGNHRFQSLATTPQAIHDLLVSLAPENPAQAVVVMETCDTSGWVHDIATALKFSVLIRAASRVSAMSAATRVWSPSRSRAAR